MQSKKVEVAVTASPIKFEDMQNTLDEIWRTAEKARKTLQAMETGNAANAVQLGKAMALVYVAETAAKDAASTLGRTSTDLWI